MGYSIDVTRDDYAVDVWNGGYARLDGTSRDYPGCMDGRSPGHGVRVTILQMDRIIMRLATLTDDDYDLLRTLAQVLIGLIDAGDGTVRVA